MFFSYSHGSQNFCSCTHKKAPSAQTYRPVASLNSTASGYSVLSALSVLLHAPAPSKGTSSVHTRTYLYHSAHSSFIYPSSLAKITTKSAGSQQTTADTTSKSVSVAQHVLCTLQVKFSPVSLQCCQKIPERTPQKIYILLFLHSLQKTSPLSFCITSSSTAEHTPHKSVNFTNVARTTRTSCSHLQAETSHCYIVQPQKKMHRLLQHLSSRPSYMLNTAFICTPSTLFENVHFSNSCITTVSSLCAVLVLDRPSLSVLRP